MNQNRQRPKAKIDPRTESVIQVKLPMVRSYSTGGGHSAGDQLEEQVDVDQKILTKKWQGYPPENLNVIGKPMPPMPEVAIPRFTGKAEYATRVVLPNMLHAKLLTSSHPRARIKTLDTSKAEKMPGVAYVLTYKNAPSTYPMPQELSFQGEIVAMVAADTEDLAEDAIELIEAEYEPLAAAATLDQVMASNAPDLRGGKGNLILQAPNAPNSDPKATWAARHGDVEKGFAEADIIKEFTYHFAGAVSIPIQPCGGVAHWEGDKLTFWGMGQGIYPSRSELAKALGIDASKIRFINKYNGCTFGAARSGSENFYPWIAHIAKLSGRPVRLMLPKDQELAHIRIKAETLTKFKVGMKKDGQIAALTHDIHVNVGDQETAATGHSRNQTELYTSNVPNWISKWYAYKTNAIRFGASRSYYQQETKWAWENLIDEMAEAVGMDPVKFRLMHITKPGTMLSSSPFVISAGRQQGRFTYDSFASVEVLEEGAKAFGWEKRNPKPGGNPGRFKRGMGVGMSQHHAGEVGYHDGEAYFEKRLQAGARQVFGAEIEVGADGYVTMKNALPDSGSNHATALAALVAEMLGFTTRDRVRVVWGDSELTPVSDEWYAGKTITFQGAAICSAVDKLKKDLLQRASATLKVDATRLQIKDGIISSTEDPRKKTTFADLSKAAKGPIRQSGRSASGERGELIKGVGACFLEVEVDTWTGDWRFIRSVYSHDTGLVVNPLAAEADMHGSLVESVQLATDPIPWDREFPGTRHYSVGYLSYRLPTIMDVPPEQTQVFIDTLEPRWFYGIKSFSETSIGAVPGALSNAIYNACGVRIRQHPVTRDKIMAGLKANQTN